jgi:hypothetical protein
MYTLRFYSYMYVISNLQLLSNLYYIQMCS